ncbi:MAG: GTP-binding protein [Candidatus Lokiarchaeota archaeon]|nr:GTP-binding protein [Candidatus Harpocratesius repetitus]
MSESDEIYVQQRDEGEITYKIIVIGDPAIGKTSLIRKYVKYQFEKDYIPTVGVSISKQPIELNIGGKQIKINLMLWDLAGQPQFFLLHKVYFNGANGVLLGFDLTRTHTYSNTKEWHKELVKNGLTALPMVYFGNKSDLKDERKVAQPHIEYMQEQLGIPDYVETSALSGDNVDRLFELIARRIYEKRQNEKITSK